MCIRVGDPSNISANHRPGSPCRETSITRYDLELTRVQDVYHDNLQRFLLVDALIYTLYRKFRHFRIGIIGFAVRGSYLDSSEK